ncbi:acyltransferase family protein [Hydrogenophaga sp.]|uniref:acyltransferase family protein n=1 Tax=Hydrogenophaga sp. TaxID=1904254 RepID=UPI003565451F
MSAHSAVSAPDTPAHLDHLDGWRGLAIVCLLIGHFFPVPGINLGAVGVNLFFVLSGLLMGGLLFVRKTPLPLFYKRRLSRILPAHLVFIGSTLLVYAWLGRDIGWADTWAALFFVNNYFSDLEPVRAMPFGHVWSLSVEEHSYVLLSIVALLARRFGVSASWVVGLLAAGFAGMGVVYWVRADGDGAALYALWLHTEVAAFGIFAAVLLLLLFRSRTLPTLPGLAYPALFALALMAHWWSVPAPLKLVLGVGLMALLVHLLGSAPAWVLRCLSGRVLRLLGRWSFSLYLWQQPFYLAMHREQMPVAWALPLALLCGVLSFYLVENPARRFLNRRWAEPRPALGGASVKPV